MNRRMNRNRLNIGAYYLRDYARTEQHFKDLSDCGIDFIAAYGEGRDKLDLFEKYGIARSAWSYKEMDFGLSDERLDDVRSELLQYL